MLRIAGWSLIGLLIEPGLRFDWDQIVRARLFSPRLAGTYVLDNESNTKLSAGIGITYDTTILGLIHQAAWRGKEWIIF